MMSIEKLTNGDIMIQVEDEDDLEELHLWSSEELSKHLPDLSSHGMIYQEKTNKDASVDRTLIHSQIGSKQIGVRNKPLEEYISPTQFMLGEVYIFDIKDKAVQEKLSKVAEKWDPKLTYEQAKKRPRNKEGTVLLPTPTHFRNKEIKDDEDLKEKIKYIIYRGFRAFVRNRTPFITKYDNLNLVAQPLSKRKGVSCSDFISYSAKVALIESIFPEGLPAEIIKSMEAIELYKKENHLTKIEYVKDELLDAFVKNVMKYISEDSPYFAQLVKPVKGMGIEFFSNSAFDKPEFWNFKGYLCYVSSEEMTNKNYTPYVIDHDTYQKLIAANHNKMHTIIITEDELRNIGLELPDKLIASKKSL